MPITESTLENKNSLTGVLSIHPPSGKPACEFSQVFILAPPEPYQHLHRSYQELASSGLENIASRSLVKVLDKRPQHWYKQYTDLVYELILLCDQWIFACLNERQQQLRLQVAIKRYQEHIKSATTTLLPEENTVVEQQWLQQLKNSLGEELFHAVQGKLSDGLLMNVAKMHSQTLPTDTYPLVQSLREQYLAATRVTKGLDQAILRINETEKALTILWNKENYKILSPWEAILESCRKYIDTLRMSNSFSGEFPDLNLTKQKILRKSITDLEEQYEVKIAPDSYNKILSQQYSCIFYRLSSAKLNLTPKNVDVEIICPNLDPVAIFKREINHTSVQMHECQLTSRGWRNQQHKGLSDILANPFRLPCIMVFPQLELAGTFTADQFYAILNPAINKTSKALPTIKFVETYTIRIQWNGYEIGELSHSINVLPGEIKKIVVSCQSKITQQVNASRTNSTEQQTRHQSSFDENLQNEFSSIENKTQSDQSVQKEAATMQQRNQQQQETTFTETVHTEQDDINNELTNSSDQNARQYENTVSHSKSKKSGGDLGVVSNKKKSKKTSTTTETKTNISAIENQNAEQNKQSDSLDSQKTMKLIQSQETALSLALNRETIVASQQSRDSTNKNIQNTISKVATETSANNRLSVTSSKSSEFQQQSSHLEEITISNPNMGRTLNLNFFQLRNQYSTQVFLEDVKIVVQEDTGIELENGLTLQESKVYELEEFNRIMQVGSKIDNYNIIVAALIVQHVCKHYMTIENGKATPSSLLQFDGENILTPKMIEFLQNAGISNAVKMDYQNQVASLELLLLKVANMAFQFLKQPVSTKTIHTINAGAFHVDSQIGFKSALEPFVDHQQQVKIEKQQAEIGRIHASTELMRVKTLFFANINNPPTVPGAIVKNGESMSNQQLSESEEASSNTNIDLEVSARAII